MRACDTRFTESKGSPPGMSIVQRPEPLSGHPEPERSPQRFTVSSRDIAILIALLAATTILSQFFRSALAVIAPELINDLNLSPRALGLANGGFFAALMIAQVAVGVAFDRIGPRKTVGALSILMTLGAALHALADNGPTLVAARVVTGIGCAGSFMSALVLVSAWMPPSRWSTGLSWVFGTSQIGILLAGAPLALATGVIGWRASFLGMAVLAAIAGVLFFTFVRDRPPGPPVATPPREHPGVLDGVRQIVAIPGILPVFALFGVAYAAVATVTGLWAGPYLKDVFGLDAPARGLVLTVMALLQMASVLLLGPLDRRFDTRKWLIVAGAAATLIFLAALAVIPRPPLWLAVTLLCAMNATTAYNTLLLTHMRAHFPDHLAGRGSTTGNISQLAGAAVLPILTGYIPAWFGSTDAGYALEAYRLIFATLAVSLAAGLSVYVVMARDIRPSDRM
jgi:MFS family permease